MPSLNLLINVNKNVTAETFDSTGSMDDYSFTSGYDDEDRLTSWDRSNGDDQDWTLSLVGDWDSFSENGTAVSRTHNDVHELTAIGANSLTYDVKGNLLTNTDSHTYTWDIDNHLATAVVGSMAARGIEGTHEYEYDALGRRVAKEVSDDSGMTTVVTRTLYINNYQLLPPLSSVGGQVVAEYEKVDTGSMTLARTYVYGDYVDEPLSVHSTLNSQPSTLYFHTNRVFNVIGLTDINDAVVEVYTYTPYGTVDIRDPSNMSTRATSSYGNTYTFTGRRTDQETGLHYFRARYMDSVIGRFIGRDPIGYIDGGNLYRTHFVNDGIDPTGNQGAVPIPQGNPPPQKPERKFPRIYPSPDTPSTLDSPSTPSGSPDQGCWIRYLRFGSSFAAFMCADGLPLNPTSCGSGADDIEGLKRRIRRKNRCKATHDAYKDLDCKGCNDPTITPAEALSRAKCLQKELSGRSHYLDNKCDYFLDGSIRRGSEFAENGHIRQVQQIAKALATCWAKATGQPGF